MKLNLNVEVVDKPAAGVCIGVSVNESVFW